MPRRISYDEERLRTAVAASRCYSDVLRAVGLGLAGGNRQTLRKYIRQWGISTAHFDPNAVVREKMRRYGPARVPLDEVLVRESGYSRAKLKLRLFEEGLKERRCELCGQGEMWRGQRMALILDHVNGIPNDNRIENLRIACPNCAATFDTHCGRKNRLGPRRCLRCDVEFQPRSSTQRYCSQECGRRWDRRGRPRPGARRVERPPYEQLLAEVAASSYVAVGRRYGVSDNAVRKWLRDYEREEAAAAGATARGG